MEMGRTFLYQVKVDNYEMYNGSHKINQSQNL